MPRHHSPTLDLSRILRRHSSPHIVAAIPLKPPARVFGKNPTVFSPFRKRLAIAAVITREVASGGTVNLPGLGKIVCRERPERQVRNPATGETVTKAADKQVKFTIAKALKDSVNA